MEDKQNMIELTKIKEFVENKQDDIKKVGIISGSVFGVMLLLTFTHFLKGIPIFSDIFVLIGCIYSCYFSNKNLILASERAKLLANIKSQKNKITGKNPR